jgi:hypothetical protein
MTTALPGKRYYAIDAARIFCTILIVLMHCSSNSTGQPFPDASVAERSGALFFRAISEVANSELFFTVSIFLMAMVATLRPQSYSDHVLKLARRLLIPFLVWTLIYPFFSLFKASTFGYTGYQWELLGSMEFWAKAVFLGEGRYHLHFLPTLFLLALSLPIYKAAIRYPLLGLALIPLLLTHHYLDDWLYSTFWDQKEILPYLLRFSKVITYSGYGFAACAILGLLNRDLSDEQSGTILKFAIFIFTIFFLVKLTNFYEIAISGKWGGRPGFSYYAHFLNPALGFLILMMLETRVNFKAMAKVSAYNYGVYLVHPMFLDVFEIISRDWVMLPAIEVMARFGFALTCAILFTHLMGQSLRTGWIVGFDVKHMKPRKAVSPA